MDIKSDSFSENEGSFKEKSTPTFHSNFGKEMSGLLKSFNNDVNSIVLNKRKYFEKFVQDSITDTNAKVSESHVKQTEERRKRVQKFKKEFYGIMQHASTELEKIKAVEEKIQSILKMQEEKQEAEKRAYIQRLQELKKLHDKFCKGLSSLELDHMKQYKTILDNVRKDMQNLQKKLLIDVQRKEMDNMRKQLKSSFH